MVARSYGAKSGGCWYSNHNCVGAKGLPIVVGRSRFLKTPCERMAQDEGCTTDRKFGTETDHFSNDRNIEEDEFSRQFGNTAPQILLRR